MNALLLAVVLSFPGDGELSPETTRLVIEMMRASMPAPVVEEAKEPLPIVTVYAPSWCAVCKLMQKEVRDNEVLDFRFVPDQSAFPKWIAPSMSFPVAVFDSPGGQRYIDGWSGIYDFFRRYDKSQSQVEPQRTTSSNSHQGKPSANRDAQLQRQASIGSRSRGRLLYGTIPSQWTWPGDLREHLSGSPHNYSRDSLNRMSDADVVRLHDNWHNNKGRFRIAG